MFLVGNNTKNNVSMVFPSVGDVIITSEMFLATVVMEGDDIVPHCLDFFNTFVKEIGSTTKMCKIRGRTCCIHKHNTLTMHTTITSVSHHVTSLSH